MRTLKQDTADIERQSRYRFWSLVPILAVALVLGWAIGAHTAPAASSAASSDLASAPHPFLSPPNPFLSPVFLPLIARQRETHLRRVYLPVILRQ